MLSISNRWIFILILFAVFTLFFACSPAQSSSSDVSNDNIIYNGIDVSVFQGDIDFDDVETSNINIVYIRAGIGNEQDENFTSNYQKAKAAGLDFGFYFYVTADNTNEAEEQAEFFANLIKGTGYTAIPAMDFEEFEGKTNAEINEIGLAFIERLATLTSQTPMIYTDADAATNIWSNSFAIYPLWIADYNGGETPPTNNPWNDWSGYQYSDSGRVSGISTTVDLDKFK
ncbi:MAG: hypothetical protein IJC83_00340, partial [Oscillospiraceae bacterium]|nr:hypothetical protein [Oscillospiraceae bacterium]